MKIWEIWLSDKPLPDHFKKYTDTWSIISGGEIQDVTIKNIGDYLNAEHIKRMFNEFGGNWTVLNHYVRYQLMYKYGGIYLDLDVEVIKDSEIWQNKNPVFFAEKNEWINNHVMISGRNLSFVYLDLSRDTRIIYGLSDKKEINTGPGLITQYLKIDDTMYNVLPPEYTTPWNWNEKPDRSRITENTIAVHHFTHSWKK